MITPEIIINKKKNKEKIIMLTAYDYQMALLLNEIEADIILVGDSLSNVFCGNETTMPVTIDQMIYHCKAVVRGNKTALIVGDMPFLSYQVSKEKAIENAGRLLKEAGVHSVKIEINNGFSLIIRHAFL